MRLLVLMMLQRYIPLVNNLRIAVKPLFVSKIDLLVSIALSIRFALEFTRIFSVNLTANIPKISGRYKTIVLTALRPTKKLIQKIRPLLFGWHSATFLFSKPLVSVSGDKVVKKIADKAGNNPENSQQLTPSSQIAHYFDDGRRFSVSLAFTPIHN